MIRTKLEEHQIEGAKFLASKRFGLLGFKTGRGKTLTSLAALDPIVKGKRDYVVVIAPKNAIDKVWGQEIEKHSDLRYIHIEEVLERWKNGQKLEFIFDYDIILCRYSEVGKYRGVLELLMRGRILLFDEAHRLKNPSAEICRMLTFLAKDARAKWGLTATAISNSIMDLWGMMQFFEPRVFGTEWEFKRTYCVLEDKVIGRLANGRLRKVKDIVGYKNMEELKAIMTKFMMIVENDMRVDFHEIHYELSKEEEEAYLIAAEGVLEQEREQKGFAQRIPDLQRVADGSRDKNGDHIVHIRGSKYAAYLKELKKKISAGDSVILFAEYLETFDMLWNLLKEDLVGVPMYQISGKKVEDPHKFPCLVLATAGGSESLNLKFANHVFFYSVPFSVQYFVQTTGRITRMDSEYLDDLHVYLPVCEQNVDRYKNEYLKINAALINEVLGKEVNLPEKSLEDARRSMLSTLRKELLWKTKERSKKKLI